MGKKKWASFNFCTKPSIFKTLEMEIEAKKLIQKSYRKTSRMSEAFGKRLRTSDLRHLGGNIKILVSVCAREI